MEAAQGSARWRGGQGTRRRGASNPARRPAADRPGVRAHLHGALQRHGRQASRAPQGQERLAGSRRLSPPSGSRWRAPRDRVPGHPTRTHSAPPRRGAAAGPRRRSAPPASPRTRPPLRWGGPDQVPVVGTGDQVEQVRPVRRREDGRGPGLRRRAAGDGQHRVQVRERLDIGEEPPLGRGEQRPFRRFRPMSTAAGSSTMTTGQPAAARAASSEARAPARLRVRSSRSSRSSRFAPVAGRPGRPRRPSVYGPGSACTAGTSAPVAETAAAVARQARSSNPSGPVSPTSSPARIAAAGSSQRTCPSVTSPIPASTCRPTTSRTRWSHSTPASEPSGFTRGQGPFNIANTG